MLGALLIVFRESLEAGLIVGVVLAATRGVPRRGRWISLGILIGSLGASILAVFAGKLASLFNGSGQELFNACALGAAVVMLAWHNVWMAQHGREMAREMKALGSEVKLGTRSLTAVAAVVGIAVLREGSEVVLFLYGLLASEGGQIAPILMGGLLGLAGGALSTALLYFGLLAVPVRYFFSATALLVTLLAAGLSSQAVAFLQQAGYSVRWSTPLWDSAWILAEGSWGGKALHALVGYTDQPSGMQVAVYLFTLCVIWILARWNCAAVGAPKRN